MMMDKPLITMTQGKALAAFVHELRPDWDVRGILPAINGVRERGSTVEVAVAVIRCAANPTNRTPAVIAMDGPHWRPPAPESESRAMRGIEIRGRQPCCGGLHKPGAPCDPSEEERSRGRGAAAARAALRKERD